MKAALYVHEFTPIGIVASKITEFDPWKAEHIQAVRSAFAAHDIEFTLNHQPKEPTVDNTNASNIQPNDTLPGPTSPAGEHISQFFTYEHLPPHLQAVSRPFAQLLANLPRNPERTVALRKLLESKDAAVRALVAG